MTEETGKQPKCRNIELKAKLNDRNEFERCIKVAEKITNSIGSLINQKDVFFNTPAGRLKLRYLEHKKSELISYNRPDVAGPKLSEYNKLDIDDPSCLHQILADTIGVRGIIAKSRVLFLLGETRVHLDHVENLGFYLEFEVVLHPHQTVEEGQVIIDELKRVFDIREEQLISGAYIDHLRPTKKQKITFEPVSGP